VHPNSSKAKEIQIVVEDAGIPQSRDRACCHGDHSIPLHLHAYPVAGLPNPNPAGPNHVICISGGWRASPAGRENAFCCL